MCYVGAFHRNKLNLRHAVMIYGSWVFDANDENALTLVK